MTETQECLQCKKTTRRKNNFCCGACQKQYNKLHKTNIDYNDWDYIEAKIPGSKFVFKSSPIPMVLMFTLKNIVEYKLISWQVAIIICCFTIVYLITFLIRYLRL